jgi:hypothetical protein
MRGNQYAAAYRLITAVSGILDRPPPRATTTLFASDSIFKEPDRHCERSEAIHRAAKKVWIASSLRSSQ